MLIYTDIIMIVCFAVIIYMIGLSYIIFNAKTKKIIIVFSYFEKLRSVRKTANITQTKKDDFRKLEYMLKNDKKELEERFEEVFSIYNVEITDYGIFKYKWWEFENEND